MTARSLDEQFEPEVAERLRLVSEAFLALRISGRVSSYYLLEIARALDHGMLLAAIELATTLLEIWLRDLLVIRKTTQAQAKSSHELRWRMTKHDREIEGIKRGAGFAAMVEELRNLEVLDDEETVWLKHTYEKIRTPLHHGISGRIVDPTLQHGDLLTNPENKEAMFLATIFASAPDRRINQFEEFVDHEIGIHLERIVNFLAAHQIPQAQW